MLEIQSVLPIPTDQKVFMQIQQIGVKMLEARSHLWHDVKSLLLWICEIHFVQWGVKLPRPGCYLPVSCHVVKSSYLNFTSLPLTFQVLLLTTKQRLHYCPLYTTTHLLACCLFYSCLKSQRAMGTRVRRSPWLFSHIDRPWGLKQALWLAAPCSYISVFTITPCWK